MRKAQMDEARRFIDLAAALGAPTVQVFGDKLDATRREPVLAHVSSGSANWGATPATAASWSSLNRTATSSSRRC